MSPLDAGRIRALAARLVASRSVSPDLHAESRCAERIFDAFPAGLDRGRWRSDDGRPVVWAHLAGRVSAPHPGGVPSLLILGHYDTVGVAEFDTLDDTAIAFDPERLRAAFIERARADSLPEAVRADVLEEAARPGSWMFGRGALDMKSAIAAGIFALETLAGDPPAGDVWLVLTPDEEHESAGMFAAVRALARLAEHGARWIGALNLDYSDAPRLHCGVKGKMLGGLWIAGVPAHASDPLAGIDATELAAEIAVHLAGSETLAAALEAPPALLRLRDRKDHYDVQTAAEAEIHVNLMIGATSPADVWNAFEAAVEQAVVHANAHRIARARLAGRAAPPRVTMRPWHAVPPGAAAAAGDAQEPGDVRERTLQHVRRVAMARGVPLPAVVPFLLPPFYPASPAASGPLARAARRVCAAAGVPDGGPYPHISDMSYLRWSADAGRIAALIPTLGGAYRLPVEAMEALDMDVVNVGPWGHDAHGLYERVRADHAFGVLPALIADIARAAFEEAGGGRV
jgi:arginine utilization protein RocB